MKENRKKGQTKKLLILKIQIIFLLLGIILVGLVMMFSPYLENIDQRREVSQDVEAFNELVAVYRTEENQSTVLEENQPKNAQYMDLYNAMYSYNLQIYHDGQSGLVDAWSYQVDVFDLEDFGYGLDSVGLVKIPDISVEMPLYLGASYDNMSKGFAQLSHTSMPIGGENTNCVIAGHRGWNGMAYMRDVELLEIGDSVYVENPWETLEYRISEIILIEPSDVQCVYIQEGRDLLTIITCHPYGVGSHRYVLICDRYQSEQIVEAPEIRGRWVWEWHTNVSVTATENTQFESSQALIFVSEYLPWICLYLSMTLFLISLLVLFISKIIRRFKTSRKKQIPGKYSV